MYQVVYFYKAGKEKKTTLALLTSHYFNDKITEGHKILSDRIIDMVGKSVDWNVLIVSLERYDLKEKVSGISYHEISPRYMDWLANAIWSFNILKSVNIIHLLAYNKIFPVLLDRFTSMKKHKIIAHLYYHPLAFRDPKYLPIKLLSKLQMFDAIITTSKALRERLVTYSPSFYDRVHFIPPLVSEDFFQFDYISSRELTPQMKKKYGLNENDFVVSYAGHIIPQRGIFELVTAFKEASKCNSSLKLVISHSDIVFKDFSIDYLTLLRRLITKYNLEKRVVVMGKQDLRTFYTLSDLLFFGFKDSFYFTYPPLVVCEAMASGVPFILRSSPIIKELFTDRAPIYVYHHTNELVDILCEIAENRQRLYTISKILKNNARMFFPENVIRKLIEIYYLSLMR
jgi:glycosyltransferase involved in cell wall biosynthesis